MQHYSLLLVVSAGDDTKPSLHPEGANVRSLCSLHVCLRTNWINTGVAQSELDAENRGIKLGMHAMSPYHILQRKPSVKLLSGEQPPPPKKNNMSQTPWGHLRIEGHFGFHTFSTKFCNILKYGMNLKFVTIVHIFRKIIQPNAVTILKSTNEYYREIISKSSRKMDLYPAMNHGRFSSTWPWDGYCQKMFPRKSFLWLPDWALLMYDKMIFFSVTKKEYFMEDVEKYMSYWAVFLWFDVTQNEDLVL